LDPAALADDSAGLISLPEIFHKILDAINDPRTSSTHLAELVSKDANLSARLLRLVNSPYFGFAEKVATLSRALTLVGTDKLGQLVIGMSAVDAFRDVDTALFDLYGFWQHSVTCALVASALAHELDTDAEETSFVTGLLHDIGRAAVVKLAPEAVLSPASGAGTGGLSPLEAERCRWGTTHAALGGELLRTWHMPESLRLGVADHHAPGAGGLARDAVLVHVADVVAHAMDRRLLPDAPVPALESGAWESLGLTANVIDRVAVQVDGQLQEIMGVFFHGQ
jgi:putative nucleotidyltransferase with HDIG domain